MMINQTLRKNQIVFRIGILLKLSGFCFSKAILLLLLAVCFGCAENKDKTSVPDEQTVALMADLFVADAATVGLSGKTKDSLALIYYNQVFQIHSITKEEHEHNINIICLDVDRMKKVLDDTETLLKQKQTENTKAKPN